jgi:3',5'-cyclic AMP phosphodiesterase CpdA
MKKLIVFIFIAGFSLSMAAQKQKLNFKNGEFKIVQFTDTHINLSEGKNLDVYDFIKTIVDVEKPDFVILTGDVINGSNPWEGYERMAEIFKAAKVPWAVVYGNHDSESGTARKDIEDFVEKLPYCLNVDEGLPEGNSNFVLPVYGESSKVKALLYCIDSNDYSKQKPLVNGYGWIGFSQIEWYRKTSKEYTKANGGEPLPALAFFHIPLPEYTEAVNNQKYPPIGRVKEGAASPKVNSGFFVSMLEMGDVMGTFVGHDHYNDYVAYLDGIALAFGRVTKFNLPRPEWQSLPGGRVIVLKEGEHKFTTWIRDKDGNKETKIVFPDAFVEE